VKVITAGKAGFCFGVKRAIQIAFDTAKADPTGVFTLGPIIHNPQVVEKLKLEGVGVLDVMDNFDDVRVVIVRSHGVSPFVHEEIKNKGCKVIDATCPFVKKAQGYARGLHKEGYQVLIVGEEAHPEVQGILGYAGGDALVVGKDVHLDNFSIKPKIGIIAQTTQSFGNLQRVVNAALPRVAELKVYNTTCNATRKRQLETARLAGQVNLMFVVGGKNSANTKRLKTICVEKGVHVYHVETAEEIKPEWLEGIETVGITGGASTPDWIIQQVENRLKEVSQTINND